MNYAALENLKFGVIQQAGSKLNWRPDCRFIITFCHTMLELPPRYVSCHSNLSTEAPTVGGLHYSIFFVVSLAMPFSDMGLGTSRLSEQPITVTNPESNKLN